jgi:5-hydroxyisourate hydrolase
MSMSPITTHVLDLTRGRPAQGVVVNLEIARGPGLWAELARGVTDADGRIAAFDPPLAAFEPAVYRLRFETGAYFLALGTRAFYPEVHVVVQVDEPARHYHVPLLLSPFGYSTYRGS